MTTTTKNPATLLSLGVLFASLSAFAGSSSKVLVIDAGVDTSHTQLQGAININTVEAQGVKGVDDDHDGYVDDISGWNAVSNDGVFMPDYIMANFTGTNAAGAKTMLDLYTKVENGDQSALSQIRNTPGLRDQLSNLLEISHGTHVAGIINRTSGGTARIQSLNVFNGSTAETPNPGLAVPSSVAFGKLKQALPLSFFTGGEMVNAGKRIGIISGIVGRFLNKPSFLDDRSALDVLLARLKQTNDDHFKLLSGYLKASQSTVVNLSLGISVSALSDRFEELWQEECQERGLATTTKRTTDQENNFQYLVKQIFGLSVDGWNSLFSGNSNVLFVIAAGNDGKKDTDAGNIDLHQVAPASSSATQPNVITVAATSQDGLIADFSCYSSTLVNVGAWGTTVNSLAPGNLEVTMSGTSMAAPFVTGVAAKVRALNPSLNAAQTRKLLEATSKKVGSLSGKTSTGGLIDATAAFAAAASKPAPLRLRLDNLVPAGRINALRSNMTFDGTEGLVHETAPEVLDLMKSF